MNMIMKVTDKWMIDLKKLECRNIQNQMTIIFEKKGPALTGRIKYLPDYMLEKGEVHPDIQTHIKREFIEADTIFFKAYFDREIRNY